LPVDLDRPLLRRALSLCVVAGLHALLIALLLAQSGMVERLVPRVFVSMRILQAARPPQPLPPLTPTLRMPDLPPPPVPDIVSAQSPPPASPRAVTRAAPHPPAISHFGPANDDLGLDVDVAATTGGGGARSRGSLGEFQAAVKRAVLARRVQPTLAWDRRNTCVVNYTVSVARDGSLAGLRIDPCAVPEINAAAEAAIRAAAPFPPPPDLGGARTDVHGTLVFHP
jgi:protein TonB